MAICIFFHQVVSIFDQPIHLVLKMLRVYTELLNVFEYFCNRYEGMFVDNHTPF